MFYYHHYRQRSWVSCRSQMPQVPFHPRSRSLWSPIARRGLKPRPLQPSQRCWQRRRAHGEWVWMKMMKPHAFFQMQPSTNLKTLVIVICILSRYTETSLWAWSGIVPTSYPYILIYMLKPPKTEGRRKFVTAPGITVRTAVESLDTKSLGSVIFIHRSLDLLA